MILVLIVVVGGLLLGLIFGLLELILRRIVRTVPDDVCEDVELTPEQLETALRGLGFVKRPQSNVHDFTPAKPSETRH